MCYKYNYMSIELSSDERLPISEYEPLLSQTEELEALSEARQNGIRSGYVEVATGGGKTYASALDVKRMLEEEPSGRILYLCHSPLILQHARETYEVVLPTSVSHGNLHSGQREHDTQAVYATFDTMNGSEAGQQRYKMFDPAEFQYVVVDEGHHGPAETYQPVINHFKPGYQLLGQTATAERMDGKRLESIFGPRLYEYRLEEAIADGVLAKPDYRLYTEQEKLVHDTVASIGAISLGDLNRRLANIRLSEAYKNTIARAIFEVQSENHDPRTIVYCPSIEYAEEFAQKLRGSLPLHSGLSPEDRDGRLKMFREGYLPTLLVVDQLNEGVDIPEINTLVFLRGTLSKRIFLQQLGRGLRRTPGKDKVIALDFAASWERIKLIADLKADVEQIHTDPRRQVKRRRGTIQTAPTQMDEVPFSFTFSKEALDALEVIKQTRSVRNKETAANPNKGKRLAQWEKNDKLVMEMLNLQELPNQSITAKEFKKYGEQIAKGDMDAREEFVMRRLRLIMKIALRSYEQQHESSALTLEDHFQNVTEGLYKLLDKYDPEKYPDFRTYLATMNRLSHIKNETYNTADLIRIPVHIYERLEKINTCIDKYEQQHGAKPSAEYVSERTGLDPADIRELIHMQDRSQNPEPLNIARNIIGQRTVDIIDEAALQEAKNNIRELLENLSYRERRIIELRFGLNGEHSQDQDTVGRMFNITRERIRQIENQALKKLENLEESGPLLRPVSWVTNSQEGPSKLPPSIDQIRQVQKRLLYLRLHPVGSLRHEEQEKRRELMRVLHNYLEEHAPAVQVGFLKIEKERATKLAAKAKAESEQAALITPADDSSVDWDKVFAEEEAAQKAREQSAEETDQSGVDKELAAALRERDKLNREIARLRRKSREGY